MIKIPHPLNPNLSHSFDLSKYAAIGGDIDYGDARGRLEKLIDKIEDKTLRPRYQENLEKLEELKGDKVRALALYALTLEVTAATTGNIENEQWLEKHALDILYGTTDRPPGFFQGKGKEEEMVVVEPALKKARVQNKYTQIEQRVYRMLRPLYNFVGTIGIGTDTRYHYVYKDGVKSLRQLKSPIVTDVATDEEFMAQNDFLGDDILGKLWDNAAWNDEAYFWEHVDEEIFEHILADNTLGAIRNAWSYLGCKYGTFKIYIYDACIASHFAKLVSVMLREATGGNAYPKMIDGGGRMNYFVSAGIKTRQSLKTEKYLLHIWFDGVYKVQGKFELRK
jgi:hypothetical protein